MDLHNLRQLFEEMVPFVKKVGIVLDEAAPGHVRLRFPRDPTNFNHVGSYHAGALFTFAETAAAAALAVSDVFGKYRVLVKAGEISYSRGVYDDITCTVDLTAEQVARATSVIDAEGRGLFPIEVAFLDKEDNECARATLTFHLKRL